VTAPPSPRELFFPPRSNHRANSCASAHDEPDTPDSGWRPTRRHAATQPSLTVESGEGCQAGSKECPADPGSRNQWIHVLNRRY